MLLDAEVYSFITQLAWKFKV